MPVSPIFVHTYNSSHFHFLLKVQLNSRSPGGHFRFDQNESTVRSTSGPNLVLLDQSEPKFSLHPRLVGFLAQARHFVKRLSVIRIYRAMCTVIRKNIKCMRTAMANYFGKDKMDFISSFNVHYGQLETPKISGFKQQIVIIFIAAQGYIALLLIIIHFSNPTR